MMTNIPQKHTHLRQKVKEMLWDVIVGNISTIFNEEVGFDFGYMMGT